MDKETLDFMLAVSSTKFEASRTLNSRTDNDYDDEDEDEENYTTKFPCPWCPEEFDLVVLCCHIDDEHYGEGRSGLCPVCTTKVGMDMIGHLTTNHANMMKIQHKLRGLKGESNSALSVALKKELEDEHLKCLLETSTYATSTSQIMDADPLLSSFMYTIPCLDPSGSLQPTSTSTETIMSNKIQDENKPERKNQQPPLSDKDQEEKARKSEFAQGLLWSTISDDNL